MDKNKLIKENLEHYLSSTKKLFKEQMSFSNFLQNELDDFENVEWFTNENIDIEKFKKEEKSKLKELLNDNNLHREIENVIEELVNVKDNKIQEYIENQLINNLSDISLNLPKEKNNFKLNLLFLEHDYEPEAYFFGYEDPNYKFKLLSGQEYLEFDYTKELPNINIDNRFDYTPFLQPLLKFEEEKGEDKVDMINEASGFVSYLEEIKKLFLLNGYLGIHLCLNRIKGEIRELNIPMRDEVFIFGNEHDCEQLNIYVL